MWDGQADLADHATQCLRAIVDDPDTALAVAFTDFGVYDPAGFPESFAAACLAVAAETDKPVVAATYTSRQFHPAVMAALAEAGVPVLDGMRNAVAAVGRRSTMRDRLGRRADRRPGRGGRRRPARASRARGRSGRRRRSAILGELGVPVPATAVVADDVDAAVAAAGGSVPRGDEDGAAAHKSDVGGVRVGLASAEAESATAYREMAARLGPTVIVAEQVGRESRSRSASSATRRSGRC